MWWIKVLIYAAVIIACQSAVVLLARLYFVKGGTSKWISLISQLGGFPVLIPYYIYSNFIKHRHNVNDHHLPPLTYGSFYVFQGILIWGSTYLYTIGLQYLPVSTSTIIASSQLAFNALFSYFINSQKFTPFITNSLFLLTLSSVLLVFGGDPSGSTSTGGGKYAVGFICTVAGAAGFGLYFSVSEYGFRKLGAGLRVVMNMMMFQGMVASGLGLIGASIGLFASGEWRGLRKEMEEYELGEMSYVMTLVWTGLNWQIFSVATMALVFEVSSVFSNAVGTVGLPLTPMVAVVVFHDRMSGVKAIAMVLAVWGFVSYLYQHYLDGRRRSSGSGVIQEDSGTC
ncbi:Purine permease 21 [Linum perenne]